RAQQHRRHTGRAGRARCVHAPLRTAPARPAERRGSVVLRASGSRRWRAALHRPSRHVRRSAPRTARRLAGACRRAVLPGHGGPGTGKTAVALHRTAFLLYTNRERIERSGVLLVGPNRVFLRYIDQVLPALGEADAVVMSTPGQLFPGVTATAFDPPAVAAVK